LLIRRAYTIDLDGADSSGPRQQWPFTIPAVSQVAAVGLDFDKPVTILVGENGSGKSTLIEAIAEAYGLDARGGRAGRKYGNARSKSVLGEILRLETTAEGARMRGGPRLGRQGYFLRAETAFGFMESVAGMQGYWTENTAEMSHGEAFLTVLAAMFRERGLYLMDEPEAALSFTSCLALVGLLSQLSGAGAQVVCATHSPILAATPGADIIELGEHGLHRVDWENVEMVRHWRRFLSRPDSYLHDDAE
jgi:predicted ATPase